MTVGRNITLTLTLKNSSFGAMNYSIERFIARAMAVCLTAIKIWLDPRWVLYSKTDWPIGRLIIDRNITLTLT
jgi:hypothetical protein